jgi:HEAT repeat protein
VHGLGVLFMIFSVSTLVIQLFVGSRLISALGIIGSMIVHPIVTIISLLGLTISFNFYFAVLAKNNFTLTTAIFNNAYASTYYTWKEKVLIHGREFIEGVVRPVGAFAGTVVLIILSLILNSKGIIFAVNVLMIVVAGMFLYITIRQRNNYTEAVLKDFTSSDDKKVRMNAIDILSQKGHVNSLPVLTKFLHKKDESVALRVRVLRAFAETQEEEAIKDIIKCFTSEKAAIREAAIDALLKYHVLSQPSKKYAVLKYELVGALKKMYEVENHEDIRSRIITLLSKLSNVSTLEFLLNILHKAHGNLKADAIYALGNYGDKDVIEFIRPYLKSNSKERINAAIALGRFPDHRVESTYIISSFIFSKSKEEVAYGLYAVGELNLKKFKKICLLYIHSKNVQLKMYSALALAKMGCHDATLVIIDLLFHENKEVAKRVKDMIRNVDVRIYKNIDKIVRCVVDKEVEKLIKKHKVKHWSDLEKEHLVTLKWLYCLVEEYDEVELIDNLI